MTIERKDRPEPHRCLAIILGASRWTEFKALDSKEASPAYCGAAKSFEEYLISPHGLGIPEENLLNLFDERTVVIEQDRAIRKFVLHKKHEIQDLQDLILVFIGHGSTTQSGKFIFILGSTNQDQRDITSYRSESLGRALKETAPTLRKWIFLDCCAAQAAYTDFQPATEPSRVLEAEAEVCFPSDGAAFFAACSSDSFAYDDPGAGSRMFTAALIAVLKRGTPALGPRMTLSQVAPLVREEIIRRHGPDAVLPYVGDPDQRKGWISHEVPFFPNPAHCSGLELAQGAAADTSTGLVSRIKPLGGFKRGVLAFRHRYHAPIDRPTVGPRWLRKNWKYLVPVLLVALVVAGWQLRPPPEYVETKLTSGGFDPSYMDMQQLPGTQCGQPSTNFTPDHVDVHVNEWTKVQWDASYICRIQGIGGNVVGKVDWGTPNHDVNRIPTAHSLPGKDARGEWGTMEFRYLRQGNYTVSLDMTAYCIDRDQPPRECTSRGVFDVRVGH